MAKLVTTEKWISKAVEVHGNTYDYSKVVYLGANNKVLIDCPKHGEFWQRANDHVNGSGCKECARILRNQKTTSNKEEFIKKALVRHGDKYTYTGVEYVNNRTKVIIICPVHGPFEQKPNSHLSGIGCPKCGGTGKLSTKEFIARSRESHDKFYDYSNTVYKNHASKVKIVCPMHGEFEQSPYDHMTGSGCPKCGFEKISKHRLKPPEYYLKEVKEVHGDKYDYSLTEYTEADNSIIIICPEHGEFIQSANSHLKGRGCPSCAISGFKPILPGLLYYLKIDTGSEILYKVGITNNSIDKRFTVRDRSLITILHQVWYRNGQEAYNEEQRILKQFKKCKYQGPDILNSGNTELFTEDILSLEISCIAL